MRALALISVITFFLAQPAFAEPHVYFRSNGEFVSKGKTYKSGFFMPYLMDADEVFKSNPKALAEYEAHVHDAKWAGILNWGALGVFLVYSVATTSSGSYDSGTGLTIFAIPWFGGIYMASQAGSHLLKAVNIVNGVPAEEARRERSTEALQLPILAWSF